MVLPDVKEKWTGSIYEVKIGATKEEGGTREKVVKVGGQTTLPFLTFEGIVPNKPALAAFVGDTIPDWPEALVNAIGKEINSPAEWAAKSVEVFKADLVSLKLVGASSTTKKKSPAECAKVVTDVLRAVKVPLIIWGCGDEEIDNLVMPECSVAARGENCLLGSAKETNYKTMVAICKADKHKLIAEAPVDINIGKQVNILLQDAGFAIEDIIMIQTTAALGYGFDYVYTILERARIAGLKGDKLMASPQICDVGGETWRVKEALSEEDALPGWGPLAKRGMMWEAVCATGYLNAGADILVMAHPDSMKVMKEYIGSMG
jgi:acetyl-CoA decarbonylase/synthase, CODH/ACS complex subunit delta